MEMIRRIKKMSRKNKNPNKKLQSKENSKDSPSKPMRNNSK